MNIITLQPLPKPTKAIVTIPGSKSYTNRALLLAALTKGEITIENPLLSDDTNAMRECLQALGITIQEGHDSFIVSGDITQIKNNEYHLNARLSGTTIRFLLALCCVIPGTKILTGEEGLNKRPIGTLVDALRELGAHISYLEKAGFPPVKITSSKLTNHIVNMRGDISSQYFSALLMIAPLMNGLTITVAGEQISKPYIDMTIDSMKTFGVHPENDTYRTYTIADGQRYSATAYRVEGDFSSAGYFMAIAALTKSTITLKNLNPFSAQADRKMLDVVSQMGTRVSDLNNSITVQGNGVIPLTLDMIGFPDQAQTVAVLAAFADGVSVLKGIQSLRIKETERVVAIQQELAKMGILTEATNDTLTIYGGNPKPAQISTYGDHRMAMSFAIAGSKLAGMSIENPEVVNKTFPDFWKRLKLIGIEINSSGERKYKNKTTRGTRDTRDTPGTLKI